MKKKSTLLFSVVLFLVGLLFVACPSQNEVTPEVPSQPEGGASFTVSFNTNGGSTVNPITGIKSGETITLPANPTKDQHTFIGWYTDNATFKEAFTNETPVTASITVYASWQAEEGVKYTVTFDAKEGTPEPSAITDIDPGTTVILPAAPSKTEFDFVGWFMDDGTFSKPFTSETLVTASITVYAKWVPDNPNTHIVTFNSKDGSVVEPIYVEDGGTIENLPEPTKEGFTFAGWKFGYEWRPSSLTSTTVITKDIAAFAEWTCTVTFDSRGGTEVGPINVEQVGYDLGSKFPSAPPTREGYDFGGWYTDLEFTQYFDRYFDVDTNITVYAKWYFTVNFDKNTQGDSIDFYSRESSIEPNATISFNIPHRNDYFFGGWYTDRTNQTPETLFTIETKVVDNITLYAKWFLIQESDNLKFNLNRDGMTYTVEPKALSVTGDINIPTFFDEKKVTEIYFGYDYAYVGIENFFVETGNEFYSAVNGVLYTQDKKTLVRYPLGKNSVSFSVPDGVVTIGKNAFRNSMSHTPELQNISFPSTLKVIEGGAFTNVPLSTLELPRSLDTLGHEAFSGTNIITLRIPSNITSVGGAFPYSDSLTTVVIEDGVQELGDDIFRGCDILTSVEIPDSVTKIGKYAFANCGSLEGITLPTNLESIPYGLFYESRKLKSIKLPSTITEIGVYAFGFCELLTTITIPASVKTIERSAFQGCDLINTVIFDEPTKPEDGLISIGSYAFLSLENLTSITLPSTLEVIEPSAFSRAGLTNIVIPDSVTTIGGSAFSGVPLLTLTLGESVEEIGDTAFQGTALTSVTIPNSVTLIEYNAFQGTPLETLVLGEKVEEIGRSAFADTKITSVTIPNSVTLIEYNAFQRTPLETLVLGESVREIGRNAFAWSALTTVTLPASIRTMGDYVFQGLETLTINVRRAEDEINGLNWHSSWSKGITDPTIFYGYTGP